MRHVNGKFLIVIDGITINGENAFESCLA